MFIEQHPVNCSEAYSVYWNQHGNDCSISVCFSNCSDYSLVLICDTIGFIYPIMSLCCSSNRTKWNRTPCRRLYSAETASIRCPAKTRLNDLVCTASAAFHNHTCSLLPFLPVPVSLRCPRELNRCRVRSVSITNGNAFCHHAKVFKVVRNLQYQSRALNICWYRYTI